MFTKKILKSVGHQTRDESLLVKTSDVRSDKTFVLRRGAIRACGSLLPWSVTKMAEKLRPTRDFSRSRRIHVKREKRHESVCSKGGTKKDRVLHSTRHLIVAEVPDGVANGGWCNRQGENVVMKPYTLYL